LVEVMTERTAE